MIWLQTRIVTDNVEMGRCDSPLAHTLAYNKEIIPIIREKNNKWHNSY